MGEAAFAERTFTLDDRPALARIHAPASAPGGEFQCVWSIAWPDGEDRGRACREDDVQALMLAPRSV